MAWLKDSLRSSKESKKNKEYREFDIRPLSSAERKERLKLSYLSSIFKNINKNVEYLDKLLDSKDFSQTEKDYILFNINRLDEIAKMGVKEFKIEVLRHQREMENETDI